MGAGGFGGSQNGAGGAGGGPLAGGAFGGSGATPPACEAPIVMDCYDGPIGTKGVGPCTQGVRSCIDGTWGPCEGQVLPLEEACDAIDNNCNGAVDDGLAGFPCDGPDEDNCMEGFSSCDGVTLGCDDSPESNTEVCNWHDDDCDGIVDENEDPSWQVETVDAAGNVGNYVSLTLDNSERAHVAYYDATLKDLKYAMRDSDGTWSMPTTVDSEGTVGVSTAIGVDADDHLFIAYRDDTKKTLKAATRSSTGDWSIVTVDNSGDVGDDVAMAVGIDGVVHVTYRDNSQSALRYARRAVDGTWSTETVDNSASVGRASSVAVDNLGTVHVSYYDSTHKDLMYARLSSGIWTHEIVDATHDSGRSSSIAVSSEGEIVITYYRATSPENDLRIATKSGDTWTANIVVPLPSPSAQYGTKSSIAFDAAGSLHVAYRDERRNSLWYGLRSADEWIGPVQIDDSADSGEFLALKVDASQHVAVAFSEGGGKDLKFAFTCAGFNPAPPARLSFEMLPEEANIDIGWTGYGHNIRWVSGAFVTLDVTGCAGAKCTMKGPVDNVQSADQQR